MAKRKVRFDELYMDPDPKYGNELAEKFVNYVMEHGKKTLARRMLYQALEVMDDQIDEEDAIHSFEEAIENVKPMIEVRSRRVGGATYQVPMEVPPQRQESLAIRWTVEAARDIRDSQGISFYKALAEELIDNYYEEGTAMQRRRNVHRMAEANKAFAHLAW